MYIDQHLSAADLRRPIARVFALAAGKVRDLDRSWDPARGTPVFTVNGTYSSRGWTEWTQGFQYGCALLAFDGSGDEALLELGRRRTREMMAPHLTHIGVHDHGFNNLSTYGNLLRLAVEGRYRADPWEIEHHRLALKCSAAVQAARWTRLHDGGGFIYSFNGPHSLFIDTIRTVRILAVGHLLGHVLMGENDERINLLGRSVRHGLTTAQANIWYGAGRDRYDLRGRVAHETIWNTVDGRLRCPSSQQGYSPFSTWTRGLAWAMLGYAEELEFLAGLRPAEFRAAGLPAKSEVLAIYREAACATCDFYLERAAALDGIPYWDTGAPNLHRLGDWRALPADPYNAHEPVDSSAAAIAAQGLIRLGLFLGAKGRRYLQAGLSVTRTLCADPYLAPVKGHQGLLLQQIYHQPNGWDHRPKGERVPCGESALWGDYHLLELAVLVQRLGRKRAPYPTFFQV